MPTFDQSGPISCGDVVTGIIQMTDDPETPIVFAYRDADDTVAYFQVTSMSQEGHKDDAPIVVHLELN